MNEPRRPRAGDAPRREASDDEHRAAILTREDIGYGPARPYEYSLPGMEQPREQRRGEARHRPDEPAPPGLGPYHQRLRRRSRPDHWIRADVEEALFLDTWVDADRITVEVDRGDVTLIGTLADREEIRSAVRTTKAVPGVERVRNLLEVRP